MADPPRDGRFQILRRLGEGGMGIVYEAYDQLTQTRVALKTLDEVDAAAIYRLKLEFRALAEISHRNLVQLYELVVEHDRYYISMELVEDAKDFITALRGSTPDPGTGLSQDGYDENRPLVGPDPERVVPEPSTALDYQQVRQAFSQLCTGVSVLHRAHRLHRDLKPANALVGADGRVVVLDFGLVTEIDGAPQGTWRSTPIGGSRHGDIIGTADYMAPEQAAGQRLTPAADWYSVGVMLFQTLTGSLPFDGSTAQVLAWKQRRDAPSAAVLAPGLPTDLVELCRDLLVRSPSARPGVDDILARLQEQPTPTITAPPARRDVFIGRKTQLAQLTTALAQATAGGTVVCHLQGSSGTGKSTLVDRFLRHASAEGAVVLSGRCYENDSVPFKSIDAVIDSLTRHLLTLKSTRLRALLPEGIDTLAQMFPVLNRIPGIGQLDTTAWAEQGMGRRLREHALFESYISPPGLIDARESRAVAFRTLATLLRRLGAQHPVVIAIDDLQWGDGEGAALLSSLLADEHPPALLLLLIYRSDDHQRHPSLEQVITLPPPRSGCLRMDIPVGLLGAADATTLAASLLGRRVTDAARHAAWIAAESRGSALLVNELAREVLRAGDRPPGAIAVDDVIWSRIERLPDDGQGILAVLCVAGQPLALRDLQGVLASPALPLTLLSRLRTERLVEMEGLQPAHLIEPAHDRIRETMLAHLPAARRQACHADLGRVLEAGGTSAPEILAEHFRQGGSPEKACRYATRAAEQAIAALAFERAEQLYLQALELATTVPERVRIAERLIHLYTDLARFGDAYAMARHAIGELGIPLAARFIKGRFIADWLALERRLADRSCDDLLQLPAATDGRIEAVIRLMNAVAKAAYQIHPQLCVWIAVQLVDLCVQHGNTRECAIGYLVYGTIFKGGIRANYQQGYDYGRLALQLVERAGNREQLAEVNFVVGYFGTSWTQPASAAEELYRAAYAAGLEQADRFHTGCAAAGVVMSMFMRGASFAEISAQIADVQGVLTTAVLREPLGVLRAATQAMRNLQGLTRDSGCFDEPDFDEAEFAAGLSSYGSRHFAHFYLIVKMQALLLWGKIEPARRLLEQGRQVVADSVGTLQQAEHVFYAALIDLAALRRATSPRGPILRAVSQTHRQLMGWSSICPTNFLAREQLVAAELARSRGRTAQAEVGYREAIASATANQQPHLAGLAAMLSAEWREERGEIEQAWTQRRLASTFFTAWGAEALSRTLMARLDPAPMPRQ